MFDKNEAQRLAHLLNSARLFHAHWRAVDLVRCTPRGLYAIHERDVRAKTLRTLIEAALSE